MYIVVSHQSCEVLQDYYANSPIVGTEIVVVPVASLTFYHNVSLTESDRKCLAIMGFGRVIGQTFNTFIDQTSIAGLSNAAQRKSLAKKVYWSVLFVLGVFFTFEGLIENVISYYEYEVTTSTDLTHMSSVEFPAVSICNLNK